MPVRSGQKKIMNMKKMMLAAAMLAVMLSVSACAKQDNNSSGSADNNIDNSANTPSAAEQTAANSVSAAVTPEQNNSINNSAVTPETATTSVEKTTMKTPDQQPDLTKQYSQAKFTTNYGDFTVKFFAADAPITVNNFLNLAQAGFYNGTKFHRIIKGFMIQGGDPLTKESDASAYGTGGPGYKFKDEVNKLDLAEGSLAMANSGPDTNGSQFFIVTSPETLHLQGYYTNFGKVVSGLDIVHKIENIPVAANPSSGEQSSPTQDVIINSIELLK